MSDAARLERELSRVRALIRVVLEPLSSGRQRTAWDRLREFANQDEAEEGTGGTEWEEIEQDW